ncbi:pimeloyl-ACP methyl ester carboxylesterase [Kribbella aluminosa]|uniref:Pimeloyl-ACP methyl ester carboxylesterase n=1 Tax=Kribbella aluminosa TaxID=416017 RepID=A0ABS4UVJ1_9ACTN|nr:alpha/beta fold hydrolase [Kribbella aluminosa]MBP2355636.1 pimeloyl-ACP methyl ester carboxylesterase [Kribbella aluminosa]
MLKLLALAASGMLTTNVLTPPAQTLTWGECPGGPGSVGIQCATLKVPVDWDHPNGRRLTLTIGRLRSTAPKPKGSVLVNFGGPVGISIDLMRKYGGGESFAGLRQKMDIVTWDLRGGPNLPGLSTNLRCDWTGARIPALPRDQAEFDRIAATNRAAAERCQAKDPELFGAMDSATHARDADAIRQALGERQTSFYGASYGGFIGQAYAQLFPQRVRAMVLDGTWNHSAADWDRELARLARDVQSYLIRFFDWCRTQGNCANAPALWQRITARADRTPLPAGDVKYGGDDIRAQGVALARVGAASYPRLAAALEKAASTGDASGFIPDPPNAPFAMTASPGVVECTDWPHPADHRQLEQQVRRMRAAAPYTGAVATIEQAMLSCVGWPIPVRNRPAALPDGLPPLLMAGNWSEFQAASRVVDQVPGSGSIYHDGPGHTLYQFNACARAKIDAYLAELVVPARGTRC